ncbi:MAG TPA: oligopeptidase B [Flavobacteriales bacterium]|jgi:oligopeptidase B|nr:S9 family peptidase [Flavobacteriales bacterium]HAW21127.1 oligopeptidase B [Flavobacteriales bacterium]
MPRTTPPIAKKVPYDSTIHGDTRIDDYHWLRDMDRKDPEILKYLNEENEYTQSAMSHTTDMQTELFDELKGRIKQTDESVPYLHEGFYYYTRYEAEKEYPIYCRKEGSLEGDEVILLDENVLAADYSFYQIGGFQISTNKDFLAYSEDTLSRRIYSIKIKRISDGGYFEDVIEGTSGNFVWANDNKTIFYSRKDEVTLRSHKIFKHTLGSDPATDIEVFHEEDETYNVGVGKFKSKKWLYIHSGSTVADEYRLLNAETPEGDWNVMQPRVRDLEYGLAHYKDHFYILTNLEARNFRLMRTHETMTSLENWEEIIPHRSDVLLEDMDVFTDYLVLSEKEQAQGRIRIIHWDSNADHYIEFDEDIYAAGPTVNPDFDSQTLRLSYTSLTTPPSVIDYNMDTRERIVLKEKEVLGGFDKSDYVASRVWITARDGAQIPVSIVGHKNTKQSKDTPLLLYGYGSYGHTIEPYFSPSRLSLLNRGFVFAIAHIRGSQTMGRHWYDDGKLLKKKNTFTDFIDCADALIRMNHTSAKHLYAMGGSAGGLLMGAIINMRPELWNGIIAAVPFVDVVSTMLDETIPLTTGEFDEWGNPKDELFYWYIKDYSPYDNIEAKDYPNMLVTTGLHDSQVQYWEPAKWVAKLRDMKTDKNELLLHTNMEFGHGGASGRFEVYKEIALEYAFLLDLESKNDD